jgi:hypothetical protein
VFVENGQRNHWSVQSPLRSYEEIDLYARRRITRRYQNAFNIGVLSTTLAKSRHDTPASAQQFVSRASASGAQEDPRSQVSWLACSALRTARYAPRPKPPILTQSAAGRGPCHKFMAKLRSPIKGRNLSQISTSPNLTSAVSQMRLLRGSMDHSERRLQ